MLQEDAFVPSEYVHLVVVVDSSTGTPVPQVYINGQVKILMNTIPFSGTVLTTRYNNSVHFYKRPDSTTSKNWYGNVDETAFFNRPLSSDEVTTIYNNGKAFDFSRANNGTTMSGLIAWYRFGDSYDLSGDELSYPADQDLDGTKVFDQSGNANDLTVQNTSGQLIKKTDASPTTSFSYETGLGRQKAVPAITFPTASMIVGV